ncbi:MAG: glycosyltransferase, partial [bacterium]
QYWIDSLNPITWLTTFWRMRRFRPDAVVLQWWTAFWTPVWSALGLLNRILLHKPLIYICHNVLPHERHIWDLYLARLALFWGTRFVVQSSQEGERLLSLNPGAQMDIVPHPVYDMFADQRVTREKAREQLGLPAKVPILLFFGIVRDYKGLADVISALPEIRIRLGDARLVVAGEFWDDKRPYLEMIDELGIGDLVIIDDRYIPNEEVALYFSAADVLVAPYRRVTGSGVVQMARSFGLPIIDSAIAGRDDEPALAGDTVSEAEWCNAVVRFLERGRPELTNTAQQIEASASFQEVARVLERPL